MPISLYPVCWRGRTDCEPLQCIDSAPLSTTEEQLYNLDYMPTSFVCSGCVNLESRAIPQDMYRLCFKNGATDEMTDNDIQDVSHILAVLSHTLAVDASRKINNGTLEIPTQQSLEKTQS